MKGYKVFNSDWTCRDFKYKVGEIYEMDDSPILCMRGFHFCTNPVDCFRYYKFEDDVKIAEVEALGEIKEKYEPWADSKRCTNKIKIVRELSLEKAKIKVVKKKVPTIIQNILHPYALVHEPVISEDMIDDYITVEIIQSIKFSEEE